MIKEQTGLLFKTYNIILKWSLYLLFFLLPLFFLPWTSNVLDFNKQALLIGLVSISFSFWILKALTFGKLEAKTTAIHIFAAILLIVAVVSTFFSLNKYGSFWGTGGVYHESLLTIIFLAFFYFLIISSFRKKDVFYSLSLLTVSFFFSAVYGIFQLFGKFIIPVDFTRSAAFNTIGSVDALAVFGAVMLPIIISMAMVSRRALKVFFIIIMAIDTMLLVIINFSPAWFAVIAGVSLIIVLGIQKRNYFDSRWLIFPMFFLAVSISLFFFKFQIPGLAERPIDLYLKNKAGLEISIRSLKEMPAFGSGPGTFAFDYSKHKDSSLNKTIFWNFKTDDGGSKINTILATQGILGILSLLLLTAVFIFKGIIFFIGKKREESATDSNSSFSWLIGIGIFSSFVALIVSNFLHKSNMTLEFLFYAMIALFISLLFQDKKELILKQSSFMTLAFGFFFTLVFIFSLGILIIEGQRYAAEVYYMQGLKAWAEGSNGKTIEKISKAASINQKSDIYLMDLSKAYLQEINIELEKKDVPKEEMNQKVQIFVKNAVNSSVLATNLNPYNVSAWSVKGFVCQNLIGTVEGIDEWAEKAYDEAIKLEPLNPYFPTQQGIVYLTKFSILSSQQKDKQMTPQQEALLNNAKDKFNRAIELKSDYASARFQLATAYNLLGKTEEAIAELEKTKETVPSDIGVAFQLGLAYYQNSDYDNAKKEFERAVSLNDSYSNALYFLGLTYDKIGDKEKAMKVVEKVLELNPDNAEVKQALENLKSGRGALEGIEETTPIEDNPEEIKDEY